jgi:2-iminobutanoate/2-iminopropanoate deaminase
MARRQTLQVQGFSHTNPIPAAARVGPLLMSGLINGTDPTTGQLADTLEAQCACMFQQVRHVLAAGGGTPAHLVRMTVWLKDRAQRGPLNAQWLAMFPNDTDRPARLSLQHVVANRVRRPQSLINVFRVEKGSSAIRFLRPQPRQSHNLTTEDSENTEGKKKLKHGKLLTKKFYNVTPKLFI